MRPRFTSLVLAATLALGGLAGALALAAPAHAEEGCPLPAGGTMLSKSAMKQALAGQGFVTVRGLHAVGSCYSARVIDKAGHRGELLVDAATGKVLSNAQGAN